MIKEELTLFDKVDELIPSRLRNEDVYQLCFELLREFVEPIGFRSERKFAKELQEIYRGNWSAPYQLILNYSRGTRNAIKISELVGEVDCVRKYFPKKSFCSISLTEEEREEFYSKYPKLILGHYSERGRTWFKWGYFFSYVNAEGKNVSVSYMIDLRAYQRYGYRSWVVKDGKRLPLIVWEEVSKTLEKVSEDIVEVREKFVMRGFFTVGWNVGFGRFLTDHGARKRIYPTKVYGKYWDRYFEVGSRVLNYGYGGLLSVRFKDVREKGKRVFGKRIVGEGSYTTVGGFILVRKGFIFVIDAGSVGHREEVWSDSYAGDCLAENRNYFVPSSAYTRLYLQAYLYDEDVAVQWNRGFTFLDSYQYFRMPVFFVELWYRIWSKVGKKVWKNFFVKTEKEKLARVLAILLDLAAASDRVYLYTRTRRELLADGTIKAGGNHVIGDEKEI